MKSDGSKPVSSVLEPLTNTQSKASPSVKHGVMLGLLPAIPFLVLCLRNQLVSLPWVSRAMWVGSLALNLGAVTRPGRIDLEKATDKNVHWAVFFEPSSWKTIWTVIFGLELLTSFYVGSGAEPNNAIVNTTPYIVSGYLLHTLWCAAFRPENQNSLWLPALILAASSLSFVLAHAELSSAILYFQQKQLKGYANRLLVLRVPITLHAVWLSAASMLNVNTWLAVSGASFEAQLSSVFLLAFFGTKVGAVLAWQFQDPIAAFTIAWALFSLSLRNLEEAEKAKKDEGGLSEGGDRWLYSRARGSLAIVERVLSGAMVLFGVAIFLHKGTF